MTLDAGTATTALAALVGGAVGILLPRVAAAGDGIARARRDTAWWAAATATVYAVVAASASAPRHTERPVGVVSLLFFAALSVVLSVVDVRSHRLPDRIVVPAIPVSAALLVAAAFEAGEPSAAGRVIAGGAVLFTAYLVLWMLWPGGIGGGDVKLAGVIGLFLGFAGLEAFVLGAALAFVWGGLFAVAQTLARRASARLAFGPWMLLGAWSALLLTGAL